MHFSTERAHAERASAATVVFAFLMFLVSTASAQVPKKVTIVFADYHPTSYIAVKVMDEWVKLLKEKTGDAIDFKFFHTGSLLSATDMMPGIREGRADMGLMNTLYQPAEWPTATLDGLPFVTRSAEAESLAYLELYKTNPTFAAQWKKNNLHLIGRAVEGSHIGVSPTPVKSLNDLAGKSMRICSWTGKALSKL